ncbi:glycosyltransferase [Patescibacteria group bacterium]|nr:glycosyltransferase [Patescibacteria group bacterium]MBU2613027.1 glycosyltransferase [Patescibacteria group bacterium]
MRPRADYQRVSSAHRDPGGLRRLDAYVRRVGAWAVGRDPHRVRVLVRETVLGNVAFPFASLGYDVTIFEPNIASIQKATVMASELALSVGFAASMADFAERRFDAVIIDGSDAADGSEALGDIRPFLAPSGIVLCHVRSIRPDALKHAGWRCRDADRVSAFFLAMWPLFARLGLRRGSGKFHLLDASDAWAAVHVPCPFLSRGWVAEFETHDPSAPFVMHAVPTFGAGGAERLVYELVAHLPGQGFEAKAVPITGGGELETWFREHGVATVPVLRRGKFGIRTFLALRRIFRLQRPDIVHTHLFVGDTMGRAAAIAAGVPVIVSTEHNVNESYRWSHRLVNRLLAPFTSGHVAVSEEVKRVLVEKEGVKADKVRTILNGIDLDRVIGRGSRPFRDVPRLIMVGRLMFQKDHATLFKALALVKRPWRLRVVGTGPLERRLRELAERLRISSRIEWLGYRDDVPELLAASDIFCFPSRYEGLGLAAVEAAAAGVPVVASDLLPLREMFDATDVRFVPTGDVPAWAHAITETLDDPSSAVVRAARLVPKVYAEASIDRMVSRYAALYRLLLERRTS